jgi:hypothetical protein
MWFIFVCVCIRICMHRWPTFVAIIIVYVRVCEREIVFCVTDIDRLRKRVIDLLVSVCERVCVCV